MKTTLIGRIEHGIDGHDRYEHFELDEEARNQALDQKMSHLEWVRNVAEDRGFFDGSGPGQLFCNSVTVLPFPYNEDRFVVITHIQRDI